MSEPRAMQDPAAFFAALRPLTGGLDQTQVETINALLAAAAEWPTSWLAYGLATAWHEARFKPQEEWGHGKGHAYALPGKYGQPQYGRGLVQLTWDRNYMWADQALGLNGALLRDFSLALEPHYAAAILVKGMQTGAFTGKKLADYLPAELGRLEQFVPARRIINGTDRAEAIANYAVRCQLAAEQGNWA